jgi:glycosyltransferase involved in cell wall biosynthesis
MKIGYIASHLYRHTFEINEVAELVARRPRTRVYSFYRRGGSEIQSDRLNELPVEIVTQSFGSLASGLVALAAHHPLRLLGAAFELAVRSLPNPVYWFKNALAFLIAMPILDDARRHRVTHLHANFGSSPATVAWLGNRILGTTMSVTFHAFDIYYSGLSHRDPLKHRKLRDADLVVAVHRHGLEYLHALVPDVSRDKFQVIRISVVLEPTGGDGSRRAEPISPSETGRPLLVAAGNLIHKKGFDVLVRAAGILARDGVDVRIRILGEGPERHSLKSLVSAEGVGDRVELPGFYQHSELAGHLAEASALVMPSRIAPGGQRDGIPTVVVEAWLAGVPVVASLVGGMAEVIVEGKTGLVFEPEDAGALAARVRDLLESEELGRSLVRGGSKTAVEEFSPQINVEKLLREIDSIGLALTPQVGNHQAGGDEDPREVTKFDVGEQTTDHAGDERDH